MFTLAHLSDPHLGQMPLPSPGQLLGKRVFGYLSWTIRRRPIHDGPVLSALVADLKQTQPDHITVTGDITNISLPAEFARAGAWLRGLGHPADVTVVPGNHDAYVSVPWEQSLAHWAEFMSGNRGNGSDEAPTGADDFPFVRERQGVALIGVSTALPMPIRSAAGRLGERQIEILARRLRELGQRSLFRVVLIHHPPIADGISPRKRLLDSEAFAAVIAEHGAELVLHGHTHRSGLARLKSPRGHVPVIGVPSASARPHKGKGHSRYHLYRIGRNGRGWDIDIEVRGVTERLDSFVTEARFSLAVPG